MAGHLGEGGRIVIESTVAVSERAAPLDLALLKAVGLDRAAPEQRELAIAIAGRYGLDLMLKHLVLIEGRPFVTRDALLHIAHRSGQFDGISVTEPTVIDGYWRCSATVYRRDMTHPFTYPGRYPTAGGNQKFAPEMAIKVAESMALRRAFNVAAPVVEERWDVDAPVEPPTPKVTLAEKAAAKAAAVVTVLTPDAAAVIAEGETLMLVDEPWTRDRLHAAATKAGVVKQTAEVFGQVAEGRKAADLTEADWKEMAVRLGLE
jgi:hypothetical protein